MHPMAISLGSTLCGVKGGLSGTCLTRWRAQGNYSDLLVQLSNIYSQLRGDTSGQKNEDSAQGFVRSTTKYWVS